MSTLNLIGEGVFYSADYVSEQQAERLDLQDKLATADETIVVLETLLKRAAEEIRRLRADALGTHVHVIKDPSSWDRPLDWPPQPSTGGPINQPLVKIGDPPYKLQQTWSDGSGLHSREDRQLLSQLIEITNRAGVSLGEISTVGKITKATFIRD